MESFGKFVDVKVDDTKDKIFDYFKRYVDTVVQKISGEQRVKCSAKTARGVECRNLALIGGILCACHGKAKKAQKPKKQKKTDTCCLHNHDLDDILHKDCHVCQTLGNRDDSECYIEPEMIERVTALL